MVRWQSYTNSIEDVLFFGGCCLALLLVALLVRRPRSMRGIHHDESGGTYSLSLVLVTPVYVFFICILIETALMTVVKIGTLYASYSAARSAMVWLPTETPHPEKIHLAGVQAMVPFSSSLDDHVISGGATNEQGALNFFEAYQLTASPQQSQSYVSKKYDYAFKATQVKIEIESDEGSSQSEFKPRITATVSYEMPINVPAVGRIFGQRCSFAGSNFYSRVISSTATLDLESAVSQNHRLGIGYDSDFE